jgi:putative isomerase
MKETDFFIQSMWTLRRRPFEWIHQGLGVFWKTLPIKIRAWSGFLPLFAGIATDKQASRLLGTCYKIRYTFMSPYGITSLAKDEKMFDLSVTNNPSNWLGPIWLVVNYAVFKGFSIITIKKRQETCVERRLTLLEKDLRSTGSLHEYYNPFNGRPVMNGGFVNWNILAINMIEDLKNRGIYIE